MNLFWFKKKNNKNEAIKLALLAEVYKKQKKYKKALQLLSKAIKLDKANDSILYQKATVYFYAKNYKKAKSNIKEAIKINPNVYFYYLLYSDIEYKLKNIENSIQLQTESIKKQQKSYLFYEYKQQSAEKDNDTEFIDFYKNRLYSIKNS